MPRAEADPLAAGMVEECVGRLQGEGGEGLVHGLLRGEAPGQPVVGELTASVRESAC